jgi:hypothetical protein
MDDTELPGSLETYGPLLIRNFGSYDACIKFKILGLEIYWSTPVMFDMKWVLD